MPLNPGFRPSCTPGQGINFGRDEERKIAVAPSLYAFVGWMLAELDAHKSHFLDSLAALFP